MAEKVKKADERKEMRTKALHEEYDRRWLEVSHSNESFGILVELNKWFDEVETKIMNLWAIEVIEALKEA